VSYSSSIIACEHLTLQRGRRTVLTDVSLSCSGSECLTLIGPNGAGKTSLLLTLLGLLPPRRGHVKWNGQALSHYSYPQRSAIAAYVPQQRGNLPSLSIREVVSGGRYARQRAFAPYTHDDREAVDAALRATGLEPLAQRAIDAVSGGEAQKAFIAAAIAQDAQFLCLDEPTTALDPAYEHELLGVLCDWLSRGRGLIVVSHDLYLPAALGGRVVAVREGRVVADGSAESVLQPGQLRTIYGVDFEIATTASGQRTFIPVRQPGSPMAS
jgi:ABC-type cobalamin/Fe3+-siderophores transport system ATPase subunit